MKGVRLVAGTSQGRTGRGRMNSQMGLQSPLRGKTIHSRRSRTTGGRGRCYRPQSAGARVNGSIATIEEAAHDFLWRVHPHTPARGEIAIFNRSHYEDVLVPRVHKIIDKPVWEARYLRIRDFEEGLADNGTRILKFFLHISKEEQLTRFAQRLDDPHRNWKIDESDYIERGYWDTYMTAYEDAISATSNKHAPWFVIPSNHKWFRNLVVSQIIVDAMEELDMSYPKPTVDLSDIRRRYHTEAEHQKTDEKRNSR